VIKKLCMVLVIAAGFSLSAHADSLIMARSKQNFPEAMLTFQSAVKDHGYQITRVQRIDVGLIKKGYKTDKYRVVFLGKSGEIQYLVKKYPVLIPFMPPKASIYAEKNQTMLVTVNPRFLASMVSDKDKVIFYRWESDVRSVFEEFRLAE
jgi:uncharacterized protein (DUF302 family)